MFDFSWAINAKGYAIEGRSKFSISIHVVCVSTWISVSVGVFRELKQ